MQGVIPHYEVLNNGNVADVVCVNGQKDQHVDIGC